MLTIIKGADVEIVCRIVSEKTGDPYDLTDVDSVRARFKKQTGSTPAYLWFLKKDGDLSSGSDIVLNIDTTNIEEGMPITGTGIPTGSTVLKTPLSTVSPTAAGSIKISANATATATGVALAVGHIKILSSELLGKIKIVMDESFTTLLLTGDFQSFEMRVTDGDFTGHVQFLKSYHVKANVC